MPFIGPTKKDQLDASKRGRVSWRFLPPGLSHECLDLLRGLLEPKAELRYDAAVLAAHPWLLPGRPSEKHSLWQAIQADPEVARVRDMNASAEAPHEHTVSTIDTLTGAGDTNQSIVQNASQ